MASIYCSNCGNLIPTNSNFCSYCGAAQHGAASAEYRAQQSSVDHAAMRSYEAKQVKEQQKTQPETSDYIAKRHLCYRVIWSFMLGYAGITSILILLIVIGAFLVPLVFIPVLLLYFLLLFLVANLAYSYFYYCVDEHGFKKEYGIIHKRGASIPYANIQNVNITRSVSDRLLGLARIDIETAGNSVSSSREVIGGSLSQAEGHLPGLTLEQAKKVHDILLQHAANVRSKN